MGSDNRTLHLTDQKGDTQEYKVGTIGTELLSYSRQDKNGQSELYGFKSTR